MILPVSACLTPLLDIIVVPLSLYFVFILLCGAFVVAVLVFLSALSCAAHMIAFFAQPAEEDVILALRLLHAVVLCLFSLCFYLFFSFLF